MKVINYSNKKLGYNNFCNQVLPQLSTNLPVEELLLNGNQLSPLCIKELAPYSQRLTALRNLELANNHLGQAGLVTLLEIFRSMSPASPLTFLGLAHNEIRDIAIESLAAFLSVHFPKLQTLDLRNNLITDAGITLLIPALKKYDSFTLHISGNTLSDKKIAELKKIPQLVIDLELTDAQILGTEPRAKSPNPDWVFVEKHSLQGSHDLYDATVPVRDGDPYILVAAPTPSPPSSPAPFFLHF